MKTRYTTSFLISLLAICFFSHSSEVKADREGHGGGFGVSQEQEVQQAFCPVLTGNKVNPEIHSDYQGKRVFFCCLACKNAFDVNPEKYLDRLPQFSTAGHGREGSASFVDRGKHGQGLGLGRLIEPFGIVTLSLVVLTFCAGYFMRKRPKLLFRWHRRLAYVTLFVAFCHATLVLIAH